MDKGRIVHFVGFVTDLNYEDFNPLWESYMKQSTHSRDKVTLDQNDQQQQGVYKYVSRHNYSSADFRFVFMKENGRSNFPDRKAKVVQTGGYIPVKLQPTRNLLKGETKIIAFLPHGEQELDFYRRQSFRHLDIYEAYFENCAYGYVLEFYLYEQDGPELLAQLRTRPGIEAAQYKECSVASALKKSPVH